MIQEVMMILLVSYSLPLPAGCETLLLWYNVQSLGRIVYFWFYCVNHIAPHEGIAW